MFYCKTLQELWGNEYNLADQRPYSNSQSILFSIYFDPKSNWKDTEIL